jgi:hypothetical protein
MITIGEKLLSKWIKKDLFSDFQKAKKEEAEAPQQGFGIRRQEVVWETPQKGTAEKPKVYEGRFLPDKNGAFYKKYSYHMFLSGEKWAFILCPKTDGFDKYCPFCSVTSKLYQGTAADKKMAYQYKRKEKFVGNFYIIDDPRDHERDEDKKVNGTVKLYEFPAKVEMKLKTEVTDSKQGYGYRIFDPGEEGHNFILKVLATKKDPNGNVWPDYSSSQFSRNSEALGNDNEIEKIMESCVDIDEYIDSLRTNNERMVEILKAEMVWDLVSDEFNKVSGLTEMVNQARDDEPDDIDDSVWEEKDDTADDYKEPEEEKEEEEFTEEDDLDDEDLLKELEGM